MTTSMTGSRESEATAQAEVARVADAFSDLMRTVRRSKARQAAAAGDDVESATQILLRTIAAEGSMRASSLAANVQSDLSTVSRQVASLVSRGLLERQADPVDGRASLLVITEAGQAVIAAHEHIRQAFFHDTLVGWSSDDRDQFAALLTRFTSAYDDVHSHWLDDGSRRSVSNNQAKEATAE